MKTLVTLVLLTLICFLRHTSAGPVAVSVIHTGQCCPRYSEIRIPKRRVTNVKKTSGQCVENAFIVTTVCNKQICIDGESAWAKNLWVEFKKSAANGSPLSAPFNQAKCDTPRKM
ncbi:C-C motif chemokine 17-like [Toxotes jaculatrix]|uniref:C-C motif chemokine 17-like n=1 Tax=Toxotes jaculatrix TaxID=941984 RepID=UPI001B3AC379|nr:C-C motif chemokine 17-like [Toxotes jaculatrix]